MADANQAGVFISWSKNVALQVAELLKPFLEDVLGSAPIFMSRAMEGGTRWSTEVSQNLQSCNAGIVVITRENTHEPWLHFEAGALSKQVDDSLVIPLLCGASVGDIQGTPLSLFQAKAFDHDDLLSVCITLGNALGVGEVVVRRRFEKSWPELDHSVAAIPKTATPKQNELGIADVMAVVERVANQVSTIEANVRVVAMRNKLVSTENQTGMFAGFVPTFEQGRIKLRKDFLTLAADERNELFRYLYPGQKEAEGSDPPPRQPKPRSDKKK